MTTPAKSMAETLSELADERLASMATVPWHSLARSIMERTREGRPAGDTFGCVVDGRYYDVGDSFAWLHEEGGATKLVAFAVTYGASGEIEAEAARETIIPR